MSATRVNFNISDHDSTSVKSPTEMYETRTPKILEDIELDDKTCSIFRDVEDDYKPLERLFGKVTAGMAFGETGLLNLSENKLRFYNAIALK